ncbi:glycoside hydrolase family 2 protein [Occallatibacter riparius]|uniref:Glycoside hydrolase family 2 n=1 Tax=Occallatibacter riparius TaxID=1002689 RepID=A0A9J7BG91_9BACT|nr:sugar-binding domain-containing protein [Occallatibacter riparius]UWZ82012.1 glycoside hydrolase family 2 [Occallatibacter riparius]
MASASFKAKDWYTATVPGTVLTTLVNNKVYPDPAYGENNRPEIIPESLNKTSYWYRDVIDIPADYAGHHVWLNFDGINYSSEIWVNGKKIGTTRGAFIRGKFDITDRVKPGQKAIVAVLVTPQPHPGVPHEHTLKNGLGQNGGITALDGPTFLSTIGWDWLPAIRDRDTGIWQKVYLSATGPVLVKDPLVTTDLPLPRTDSSDVVVQATVENVTDQPQKGVLKGDIESIHFEQPVEIPAHSSQKVTFDPKSTPALHIDNPRLWWPNGYGPQNLYSLHLSFDAGNATSDAQDVTFGIRRISYSVPDSENLTISVNGVRVFIRGGDWGLDEMLKRIPRERLDAEIHLHQLANLNLIRNWVGQSTGPDFYELCDKYGILLWDEFFQPNPSDGPDPEDLATYMANVRDKILRYRNHPSIAVWCARNEGFPPKSIDDELQKLMAELEPTRRYQPSSTSGAGVRSNGPYHWRAPRDFYIVTDDFFKTETGSLSVPTLESIKGMMPQKDWETITDDWAEHDFAKGAQWGDKYKGQLEDRYGKVRNLADFVRKAQLMNYEAYRAMYEGRNAQLFHQTTAVITWMSAPAQPSFVWQLYHYDLEPSASLFGTRSAGELQHIQFNQANGEVQIINNLPTPLENAVADVSVYNLDGSVALQYQRHFTAPPDFATSIGPIEFPASTSNVNFVKLDLHDSTGKLLSTNFYWRANTDPHPDDLTDLSKLAPVTLQSELSRHDESGRARITVTLRNPSKNIALMTHIQLRRKSGERVLPVFYDENYVSLVPGESRTINIDADLKDLHGEDALILLDGFNTTIEPASAAGVSIAPNKDADPMQSPETGLPFQTENLRQ